jgi:nicotinamidase/pyrazinamidase
MDMEREAILVVDMLKGFLEEGRALFCGQQARRIIPRIADLLAQKKGAETIFLCDSHKPDDAEFKMFPPHCIEGSDESQIVPELAHFKGRRIPKTRYSGFFNTNLEQVLKDISPSKVTVVGVCTDICVLHTVADLRNRDYRVEVPRDCVASFDEAAHRFALGHMEKILGAHIV